MVITGARARFAARALGDGYGASPYSAGLGTATAIIRREVAGLTHVEAAGAGDVSPKQVYLKGTDAVMDVERTSSRSPPKRRASSC